jgi:hypothetical protein
MVSMRLPTFFAFLVACAPAVALPPEEARSPQAAGLLAPPAPLPEEERPENPDPGWITGWERADRATRLRLIAYSHDAAAWTTRCKEGYASRSSLAKNVSAGVEAELSAISANAVLYEAFDAFRQALAHFTRERERVVREEAIDAWEDARFFGAIEARIFNALLDWERARDPLLPAAASVRPLGARMPSTMPGAPEDEEARFCRRSRDRGTGRVPRFPIEHDLRSFVRAPFPGDDPVVAPPSLSASAQVAFSAEGVVLSASKTANGTRVELTRTWKMLQQRPPCRPARCSTIDCNMGPVRTTCQDVTVVMRANFDALFTTLPAGLTFRRGDAVAFQAAEEQTVAPPLRAHFHGIVLEWVDRKVDGVSQRVFSLGP